MTSRFLAGFLTTAVTVGLAADARCQSSGGAPPRQRGEGVASREAKTPDGEDGAAAAATSFDSGPGSATAKDPFDVAEAKVKSGGTPGVAGKDGSTGGSMESAAPRLEKATFGAGCFWHVESEFEWLPGVKSAVSGYAGGNVPNPSYEMVHEGYTGHAEVVQVEYDPSIITYEQLLRVFWRGHDPTQWNRQGPDEGPQYRSVIFYHNEAQRKAALKSYRELTAARVYHAPIVTQLMPMKAFYRAEEYHQNYYGGKDDRVASRASRSRRPAKAATRKATTPATGAKVASRKATGAKPAATKGALAAPAPAAASTPAAGGADPEP